MQMGDAAGTEAMTRVGAASKTSVQFYGKSSRDESEMVVCFLACRRKVLLQDDFASRRNSKKLNFSLSLKKLKQTDNQ